METKTNFDYKFTPLRKKGDKLIVADESERQNTEIKQTLKTCSGELRSNTFTLLAAPAFKSIVVRD